MISYNGTLIPVAVGNSDYDALVASGVTVEPYTPPPLSASDVLDAKRRVTAFADELAATITGPVPETERASWPTKEIAARAYIAGTATQSQINMLAAECSLTGETIEDLAQTIVTNADKYTAIAGIIVGQRRKTMGEIDKLEVGKASQADLQRVLETARAEALAILANLQK
jgi:hypothetical protein